MNDVDPGKVAYEEELARRQQEEWERTRKSGGGSGLGFGLGSNNQW